MVTDVTIWWKINLPTEEKTIVIPVVLVLDVKIKQFDNVFTEIYLKEGDRTGGHVIL